MPDDADAPLSFVAFKAAGYEQDFDAWARHQAALLRAGDISDIDAENIAEELEGLANRDRRELKNRLVVVLVHLLKWQLQAGKRSGSWRSTIREQRQQIEDILAGSPRLRPQFDDFLGDSYRRARRNTADVTGLAASAIPQGCPFTPEQVLSEDFLPPP